MSFGQPAQFVHRYVQPASYDYGVPNESSPDQQPVSNLRLDMGHTIRPIVLKSVQPEQYCNIFQRSELPKRPKCRPRCAECAFVRVRQGSQPTESGRPPKMERTTLRMSRNSYGGAQASRWTSLCKCTRGNIGGLDDNVSNICAQQPGRHIHVLLGSL